MSESGRDRESNRSELSGSSHEVVQARDVSGGVHFHGDAPRLPGPPPRQLPSDVRGFVNRTDELEQMDVLLAGSGGGVAIVVGTAGVGKTSLAVRWAHQIREHFPDGQLYVNLRGYDPGEPVPAEQAPDRFLQALDVPVAAIPADVSTT